MTKTEMGFLAALASVVALTSYQVITAKPEKPDGHCAWPASAAKMLGWPVCAAHAVGIEAGQDTLVEKSL